MIIVMFVCLSVCELVVDSSQILATMYSFQLPFTEREKERVIVSDILDIKGLL